MEVTRAVLAAKFEAIFPHLDQRLRRGGGRGCRGSRTRRAPVMRCHVAIRPSRHTPHLRIRVPAGERGRVPDYERSHFGRADQVVQAGLTRLN
jgi:hypothetical protein